MNTEKKYIEHDQQLGLNKNEPVLYQKYNLSELNQDEDELKENILKMVDQILPDKVQGIPFIEKVSKEL